MKDGCSWEIYKGTRNEGVNVGKILFWLLGMCFGIALIHGDMFDLVLCAVITLAVLIGDIICDG